MARLLMLAAVLVFGATLHRVAVADEPKGGKAAPPDPTADLLAKLRQPLALSPGELTMAAFVAQVEKATGVGVVVNEGALQGSEVTDDPDMVLRPVRFKGASAAAVLRLTLAKLGATYLVRRDHVEIVSNEYARRQARQSEASDANGDPVAPFPLVSAVVKEKPLNEALADLAADHDLTIVVSPQAADQKAAFVSARLLNVPADKAIELLVVQADLRVIRRGAAFLVTSREHSEGMFNERMDREQRKIEVENLRNPPGGGMFLGQLGGGNGAIGCIFGRQGGNLGGGLGGNPPPAPPGAAAPAPGGFGVGGSFGIGGNGFGSAGNGFGGNIGFAGTGMGFGGTPAVPPAKR